MSQMTWNDCKYRAKPLIAAECLFQPGLELAKKKAEISSGRLFEEFSDARAQVLFRLVNRSGQMHRRPEVAAPIGSEDPLRVRQPIEILMGQPEFDCAA